MNAPDLDSSAARSWVASSALKGYAAGLRRRAKSRSYSGPHNATQRENLRRWASVAEALSEKLRDGTYVIEEPFEPIDDQYSEPRLNSAPSPGASPPLEQEAAS